MTAKSLSIVLFFCFSWSWTALAAPGLKPGRLAIQFRSVHFADNPTPNQLTRWKRVCQQLGEALKVGQGPWGHGAFIAYDCSYRKQYLGNGKRRKASWHLQILDGKRFLGLKLIYRAGSGKKTTVVPIARLELPASTKSLAILQDPAIRDILVMMLLEKMPGSRVIKGTDVQDSFAFRGDRNETALPPPRSYNLMHAEFLSAYGKIETTALGIATLVTESGDTAPTSVEVGKSTDESAAWRIAKENFVGAPQNENEDVRYWLKIDDPHYTQESLQTMLTTRLKAFQGSFIAIKDAILETFGAGFAGIRYGLPTAKKDPLISQSHLVSLLTEVRSGPLEGLRWYWDFAPEVKTNYKGERLSFAWSRPSLGWSISLDGMWGLDRMDLVPKFGVLDLDATIPLTDAFDPDIIVPVRFRFKNVPSIGGEIGVEKNSNSFLFRLWGAYDFSRIAAGKRAETSSSLRGGIDAYRSIMTLGDSYQLSLLAFFMQERFSLSRQSSSDEAVSSTEVVLDGVDYMLGFMGIGAVLVW